MVLEWTIDCNVDFPDAEIDEIVEEAKENEWNDDRIRTAILSVVDGFDDYDYWTWSSDQTDKILEEVHRRLV